MLFGFEHAVDRDDGHAGKSDQCLPASRRVQQALVDDDNVEGAARREPDYRQADGADMFHRPADIVRTN